MKTETNFFLNTVADTIRKNALLVTGDSLLIGVSGGADSVALLTAMLELSQPALSKIGIAHLNHHLRGDESKRDSEFVEKLALKLGIDCYIETQNVKAYQEKHRLSLEDAARKLRYQFFRRTAENFGFTKIATGHTANDNAELVLMNLLRGAGPSGLSGIPVRRADIVRPLIEVTRSDVINYLALKRREHVTDSSNLDRAFLRNKIRLDLMPLIESGYNENIIESLNRTSRVIKEDEAWINETIVPLYKGVIVSENEASITVSATSMEGLHLAPQRRIVRKAIESIKGNLKKITLFHIDMILGLLKNPKHVLSVDLPDQIQVQKKDKFLIFTRHDEKLRDLKPEQLLFNYQLNTLADSSATVSIPEISGEMVFTLVDNCDGIVFKNEKPSTAWIDYSALSLPLTIRSVQSRDRFIPFGMSGSQTLKKFFSGSGIGTDDKKKCPLLISNDDIVWVGGHRLHNNYKVGTKTKKILKVELLLD